MQNDEIVANALEQLLLNQTALRAAIEEVSSWVAQRGSVNTHENVLMALHALDAGSVSIVESIEKLRS
ncbi:hypothetical protein [Pseudomonas sp. 43(2021)]|uniref:hypothetical protein n=1 Tax=Pseudomonas sp. 43(2021) TaxID=2813560 RepID=UPI001A9E81BE|nr:hypothetical protein [Pseudomonas sp. 43(2021)]